MNFDTRTVIDLMKLNEKLKDDIIFILEEESLFIKKVGKNAKVDEFMFISDTVLETIIPIIKDCLKYFLKKDLNTMDLSVIKGMVDINNVDYSELVNMLKNNVINVVKN